MDTALVTFVALFLFWFVYTGPLATEGHALFLHQGSRRVLQWLWHPKLFSNNKWNTIFVRRYIT
jgi:hypothetical protein